MSDKIVVSGQMKGHDLKRSPARHPLLEVNLTALAGRISRARAMDLHALTDDQVFERVRRLMNGYSIMRQRLQTNMVFRARRNTGEEPFTHASQLWYPPAKHVSRGRFNAAGESVFYVSNRFRAALFEMRPHPGEVFSVLVAKRRPPFREIVCAHIGMERCEAAEAVSAQPRDHPVMQQMFKTKGLASRWLAIDRYLGDISTAECQAGEEDWTYKPTNALARTFSNIPDLDAIQYPSVALSMKALNLCMTPDKADELFAPGEAWMVKVVDHRDELEGVPHSKRGFFALQFLAKTGPIEGAGHLRWTPVVGDPLPSYVHGDPSYLGERG